MKQSQKNKGQLLRRVCVKITISIATKSHAPNLMALIGKPKASNLIEDHNYFGYIDDLKEGYKLKIGYNEDGV